MPLRITGGAWRGRTLFAPAGRMTRPTQQRIREALFDILRARVNGAAVLDLFAGSGALAFEAVSRGAAAAVLVDNGAAAARVIARNLETLAIRKPIRFLKCDWARAAALLRSEGARFDLVFLDPPYAMSAQGLLDAAAALLADDGVMVYEHNRRFDPPETASAVRVDVRLYGDTALSFYTKANRNGQEDGQNSEQESSMPVDVLHE